MLSKGLARCDPQAPDEADVRYDCTETSRARQKQRGEALKKERCAKLVSFSDLQRPRQIVDHIFTSCASAQRGRVPYKEGHFHS
eukprot:6210481-Pleurochrysis_carterae.AAC.4